MKTMPFLFSIVSILMFSCKTKQVNDTQTTDFQEINHEYYELFKPKENINGVLVLFAGYPETPTDIKREFKILEVAKTNQIAVLLPKFNKHLWLETEKKQHLLTILQESFETNQLPTDNIYIGGFSSGGNVSLLLSNHLIKEKTNIQPKGVFIIDSPIDLLALYRCSEKNIKRNFSEVSMQESQMLIQMFDPYFGNPKDGIDKYEAYSPFVFETRNIDNLQELKDIKIRLYTEPDTIWWKENRQNDYEDLNAFYIKKLSTELSQTLGNERVQLIETQNKGYRANGQRHPHSWAIVDTSDLIRWMLEK